MQYSATRETRGVVNPNTVFEQVGIPGGIPSSRFDLSNQVIGTMDMGVLYPVFCRLALPGDRYQLGQRTVVRWNPLLAPILHQVDTVFYSFFCPARLLDENWEEWITGGLDGETAVSLTRWTSPSPNTAGSLWDWMGMPIGVTPHADYAPLALPRAAYNFVWNSYFRDQSFQTEVDLTSDALQYADWQKDYLASALENQQRGTAPALPVSGTTSAVWDNTTILNNGTISSNIGVNIAGSDNKLYTNTGGTTSQNNLIGALNDNFVDLSSATTFDISQFRLAAAMQQLMELNSRGGIRYTEFLKNGYGVSPTDSRLDRPEYIGKVTMPLIFSEVLQTSATDSQPSPQGNLAGHGIGAVEGMIGSYNVEEFGVILTLVCHRPKAVYTQGFDREWMPQNRYEVYHPLFANLSEQAILKGEVYATGVLAEDSAIWGYQARFSELRYARSRVAGLMHSDFDYWHLARQFSSAPALGASFLSYDSTIRKDILAAPSEPAMMVSVGNRVLVDRPIPATPVPGLGRI